MTKKKVVILILIFSLLSSMATFGFLYSTDVLYNGKVLITKNEYDEYRDISMKYGRLFEFKDFIQRNYYIPVNEEDLMVGMYKGLFEGTNDPYTQYLTKEDFEEMMISTSGEYQGIGVTMVPSEDGFILIVSVMDGAPADRIGLKSGDKIVKVNDVEYSAKTMDLAASKIRGEAGTKVKLTVLRDLELLDFDITRANVKMKSVRSEIIEDNIGYIRISTFDENTADEFKNHLRDMEIAKVDGLIIDLRNNGGGLMDQSLEIADMLMGKDVIVYTEDSQREKEYYNSDRNRTELTYVVLVNESSASSSEILTGAIKDTKSGVIIGTTTFGKGIIQRVIPLDDGDGIKITVAQYFSPNGNVIHGNGIEPDIVVEIDYDDFEDEELTLENDPQVIKAIDILTN